MRDYLERVYGVGVISVRSYVEQLPITRLTRDGRNIGPWRRQLPEKRMTVELRDPFIWPDEPTDLTEYVPPPCFLAGGFHRNGFDSVFCGFIC